MRKKDEGIKERGKKREKRDEEDAEGSVIHQSLFGSDGKITLLG